MRIPRTLFFALTVFAATSPVFSQEKMRPLDRWDILANSERLELISLSPQQTFQRAKQKDKLKVDQKTFHGWVELGRTEIKDDKTRKLVVSTFVEWVTVKETEYEETLCEFAPRHAIRSEKNGITADFLICFECRKYQVHFSRSKEAESIYKTAEPVFDKILKNSNVPLAPKSFQ